jgi:hypothetical protein
MDEEAEAMFKEEDAGPSREEQRKASRSLCWLSILYEISSGGTAFPKEDAGLSERERRSSRQSCGLSEKFREQRNSERLRGDLAGTLQRSGKGSGGLERPKNGLLF